MKLSELVALWGFAYQGYGVYDLTTPAGIVRVHRVEKWQLVHYLSSRGVPPEDIVRERVREWCIFQLIDENGKVVEDAFLPVRAVHRKLFAMLGDPDRFRAQEVDITTTKPFLTIPETLRILQVHRSTLYKMMNAGEFPYVEFSGRRLVPTTALKQWFDEVNKRALSRG